MLSINRMENPADNLGVALAGAAMGLRFIPCKPGTKVPLVKWRHFQTEAPTAAMYTAWFAKTRSNIALLTSGMVLFDCDDPDKVATVLEHCGDTPYRVKTPRGGMHLGYRKRKRTAIGNRVRIKGLPIDIRSDGGLALVPHSATERGRYEWAGIGLVPLAELPVARIGWTRERTRRQVQALDIDDNHAAIRRALAYLACIEGAIAGQRGHDKTFRAACVLVHKFNLSFEQAFPLLKEWSDCSCEPPWSDAELTHKLRDAIDRRRG